MAGSGFNPFAAGRKIYGGGRSNPTMGHVNKAGYRERDLKKQAQLAAVRRRLQSQGKPMSSGSLYPYNRNQTGY